MRTFSVIKSRTNSVEVYSHTPAGQFLVGAIIALILAYPVISRVIKNADPEPVDVTAWLNLLCAISIVFGCALLIIYAFRVLEDSQIIAVWPGLDRFITSFTRIFSSCWQYAGGLLWGAAALLAICKFVGYLSKRKSTSSAISESDAGDPDVVSLAPGSVRYTPLSRFKPTFASDLDLDLWSIRSYSAHPGVRKVVLRMISKYARKKESEIEAEAKRIESIVYERARTGTDDHLHFDRVLNNFEQGFADKYLFASAVYLGSNPNYELPKEMFSKPMVGQYRSCYYVEPTKLDDTEDDESDDEPFWTSEVISAIIR